MKLKSILINLKVSELEKIIFALPFFLIFIVNLYITRRHGFIYAGELAIFAGLSSFIAIIFSMRWDVEILVKDENSLVKSLSSGVYVVVSLSILSSSICYLLKSFGLFLDFNIYLIYSAALIALYELHINIFLKKGNLLSFVGLRILPPFFLILFTLLNLSPGSSWFFSYLLSLVFLLCSIYIYHKKVWNFSFSLVNLFKKFRTMLVPTSSAVIANSISIIWLLSIANQFGSYEAGVWINAYRIASLPIAFCGATMMPLVLVAIGNRVFYHEKFNIMFKFSYLILFVFLITGICLYTNGQAVFNYLTNSNGLIGNGALLVILAIAAMQYSMQYWKEIFQSVNRTSVVLIILSIELFLILLIYFFGDIRLFNDFINLIFSITGLCFCLFFILIVTSYTRFKQLNSLESPED